VLIRGFFQTVTSLEIYKRKKKMQMDMHFRENAAVLTSGGEKIGRIDRVVVDPATEAVTHLVVKKGLLFTRDKVVPVDQIESTTEEQVVLKQTAADPEAFPDFEQTQHIPVAGIEEFQRRQASEAQKVIWYHTRIEMPWWTQGGYPGPSKPLFVKKTRRNIPEGSIPLEEGAKVVDAGGDAVGEIEEVYAEPEEHRVTHILIARGPFSKEKKLIPSMWVKDIFESSVRLSVKNEIIENLPDPEASRRQV
jgi:uncharacterized protein YrrD